jgi:hypothetical protein
MARQDAREYVFSPMLNDFRTPPAAAGGTGSWVVRGGRLRSGTPLPVCSSGCHDIRHCGDSMEREPDQFSEPDRVGTWIWWEMTTNRWRCRSG